MKRKQLRFFGYWLGMVLLGILMVGAASCTSKDTSTTTSTTSTPPAPTTSTETTLSSIAVTPSSQQANVEIGSTLQFTATGDYSDGSSKDISSQVTWASSDSNVASIDSTGLSTGVAAGNSNITASFSGVTSTAVTLTVMTPIPQLSSITVTPAPPDNSSDLAVGSTQRFVATGTYSDGSTRDISSVVTWTSSKTSIATVDTDGLTTGVTAGSTDITAARSGVTSPAVTLTVVAATK